MALWPTASKLFLEKNGQRIRTADSRATYDKVLRMMQRRHPDKRVTQFTRDDVLSFCGESGLSSATLSQRRSVLITFFRWTCIAEDAPLSNSHLADVLLASPPPARKRKRKGKWLTPEELARVIHACDDGTELGQRDRIIVMSLAWTGLRRTELARVRWGHVDLNSCSLDVVGKGEKPATVGFNSQLREVLFEWRSRCAVGLGRPAAGDDPVIPVSGPSHGYRVQARSIIRSTGTNRPGGQPSTTPCADAVSWQGSRAWQRTTCGGRSQACLSSRWTCSRFRRLSVTTA